MDRPGNIKVSFCGDISDLEIDITPNLTYINVLHKCIDHVKDKVCDPDSDASQNIAIYLPAFGLRLLNSSSLSENPIWLPYWHQFSKTQEATYEFRVRHRPLGFSKPDSVMGQYLFIQMVDDFMKDPTLPVGDTSVVSDEIFTLLLCISLFLQNKDLPYKNKTIVDVSWETPSLRFQNFTAYPRQLLASNPVCKRLTGGRLNLQKKYWTFISLRKNIKLMKEKRQTLRFFKDLFYDLMIKCFPWYCTEVYQIEPSDYASQVTAMFKLNLDNNLSGLYYGENLECSLKDIEEMKVVNPTNLQDKKWIIRVCLRDGKVKDLPFESKAEAESFLSMAQVQVKLCVRWDCFLSYDKLTHRDKLELQLKSFGPLLEETAKKHLKDLAEKSAFQGCGFLIHQSCSDFQTYVVVSCKQAKTNTSSMASNISEMDDLQYENHHITIDAEGKMRLVKGGDDPETGNVYWTQEELSHELLNQFGLQAVPRDYPTKSELNEEYKRDTKDDEASQPALVPSSRFASEEEEMPSIFLIQDLKNQKDIKDKNIKIRKYEVTYKKKKLMQVRVVSKDQDDIEAFLEGLERLEKLRRAKPQQFLKLYTNVLGSKLTFVTELPSHGDLLTYISQVPQSPYEKLQLMKQVVATLLAMHDLKHFHGNIRSRKFLVFKEPSSQSVRLKLEFPGVTSLLDTKPITDELNVERLAWLSPERRMNLPTEPKNYTGGSYRSDRKQNQSDITYESECYAVGTTLAEILYRKDKFSDVDFIKNEEIPCPSHWFSEASSEDQAVNAECDELLRSVWDMLIKPCWNKVPSLRPLPSQLMADVVAISEKAISIAKEKKEEPKEPEYENLGASEIDPDFSVEQLREKLKDKFRDVIPPEDLTIVDDKGLGMGHFGKVYLGVMTMRQNLPVPYGMKSAGQPKQKVAVKMMKNIGSAEKSFIKEIAIAATMKHDNVLELIGAGHFMYENRKRLVLISEYMDFGSLNNCLSKCDMSDPGTIKMLMKICHDVVKGMVYLSGKNIVHRDLAPRNVVLKNMGSGQVQAKVADFGLSRMMDDNYRHYRSQTDQDIPFYTWPPECLVENISNQLFSTRGDVWSFGILLWVVFNPEKQNLQRTINGKIAHWHSNKQEVFSGLRELYCQGWRLPEHPRMPDRIYGIMTACWSENPSDRPPFVELAQTFDTLVKS